MGGDLFFYIDKGLYRGVLIYRGALNFSSDDGVYILFFSNVRAIKFIFYEMMGINFVFLTMRGYMGFFLIIGVYGGNFVIGQKH